MATKNHLVGYFDAPPDKPTVVEFVDNLEARNTIRILPYGLATAQAVNKIGADKYDGPGLAVQWVEVEGPLHDAWPPESHRRIFGDLPQEPAPIYNYRKRVEVVSDEPRGRCRADPARTSPAGPFAGTVTDDDVQPFVDTGRRRSWPASTSLRAGGARRRSRACWCRRSSCSSASSPGKLDDFALASRLSYFLWSTMPDEELLALADEGEAAASRTCCAGRSSGC